MSRGEFWREKTGEERIAAVEEIKKERRKGQEVGNRDSSLGQLATEGKAGLGQLGNGIVKTIKGITEMVVGTAKETDAAALGLGTVAIIAIGELPYAFVFAVSSRKKNIFDTNAELFHFSQNPTYARLFGYPLLAIAGGYGIWQIREALIKK